MNHDKKKIAIFFGILALVAAALIFGTNYALKLIPAEKEARRNATLPPPDVNRNMNMEDRRDSGQGRDAPAFKIQSGAVDRRPIIYTANGFAPKSLTISDTGDIGCLITVVNKSALAIRVGVNPHDEKGDPGSDYGIINPGQTGIMDVRYTGLSELTLHNHFNPAHEFAVVYGEGCALK